MNCPRCYTTLKVANCPTCGWRLLTLAEWKKLPPGMQGFVAYAQAAWPMSELAKVTNPYEPETVEWQAYIEGERWAVQQAQDSEE